MQNSFFTQVLKITGLSLMLTLLLLAFLLWHWQNMQSSITVDRFFAQKIEEAAEAETHVSLRIEELKKELVREVDLLKPDLAKGAGGYFSTRHLRILGPDREKAYRERLQKNLSRSFFLKLKKVSQKIYAKYPDIGSDAFLIQYFGADFAIQKYKAGLVVRSDDFNQIILPLDPLHENNPTHFLLRMVAGLDLINIFYRQKLASVLPPLKQLFGFDPREQKGFFPVNVSASHFEFYATSVDADPKTARFLYPLALRNGLPIERKIMGQISVCLNTDKIFQTFLNQRLKDSGYVVRPVSAKKILPENSERVFIHSEDQKSVLEPSSEEIESRLKKQEHLRFTFLDRDRILHYAIAFPDSCIRRFVHIFSIPRESLSGPIRQQVFWVGGLSGLLLGFLLFLTYKLIRRLTRPMQDLTQAISVTAKMVEQGDFSTSPVVSIHADTIELSILRKRFLKRLNEVHTHFSLLQSLFRLQAGIGQKIPVEEFSSLVDQLYRQNFGLAFQGQKGCEKLEFVESGRPNQEIEQKQLEQARDTFDEQVRFYFRKLRLEQDFLFNLKQQKEFQLASEVQKRLLSHPVLAGSYQVAAYFEAARYLGGDFFEVAEFEDHLVCAIADVAGKGLAAALYSVLVKSYFNAALEKGLPLDQALSFTNMALMRNPRDEFFCTLFAFRIQNQTISYISAGHNKMILLRGSQIIELSAPGIPLGIFAEAKYVSKSIPLQQGDKIVLYTDGVTEAENQENQLFGLARTKQLIMDYGHLNPQAMVERIGQALSSFASGRERSDDITLLVVEN